MICFTRIDNRLIHGQVVQSWLPKIKVDKVLVISRQAAQNTLMIKMMRIALPQGYALEVCSPQEAFNILKKEEERIFILVEDLEQLSSFVRQGISLKKVNIGNTKYEEGKKEFSTGVYLDEKDLAIIKDLRNKGITFIIQALPSSLEVKLDA